MAAVKMATLKANAKRLRDAATRIGNGAVSANKAEFHSVGRAFLRGVLGHLGVEGKVRSCKGGPAVGGEVILQTGSVHVCLSTFFFTGETPRGYYRLEGKDHTTMGRGWMGPNQWVPYALLVENPQSFIDTLRNMHKPKAQPAA